MTAAQLLDAGYSKRMVSDRVAQGLFERRGKGVLQLVGAEPSWEQSLLAAVMAAGPTAAASHRSASRLWGFRTVDHDIEVAVRFPRRVAANDATIHRSRDLEPDDVTEVNGIPTTTPERTICDLGLIFPETEVRRILHHAIATELVLPRDLWMMRQRTSKQGRNGTGVLERVLNALPEDAGVAESGLEVLFLEICERFGVPRPVPQLPVRVAGRNFRVDFAWPSARVFVEVDGFAFHSTPDQLAHDSTRQNLLVAQGWTPLRFTNKDLTEQPAATARSVLRTLGFVED